MASSNLGALATAFVVGAGVAYLVASTVLAPKPPAEPAPPTIHTIKILADGIATESQDPAGLRVEPEDLEVAPGDVVQFVNLVELQANITFASGTTPFLQLSSFDVPASGGTEANLTSDVIDADASDGSVYPYAVTVGGTTEQSPVIRIGPPLQSSDSK